MPQHLFPDPEPGDPEEPDGFPLPHAAEEGPGSEETGEGLGQGLYLCLPAEQLTLAGFAQNGEADTMAPGPLLATVVHTVTGEDGRGLGGCSDDQLMGIISAPLDADDSRDLAAAAAGHPRTRWCITAVNPDGTAAAHGCIPGRHPPPGIGPPGSWPPALTTPLIPVARGPCDHAHAELGYHPSRKLTHLIRARSGTCTAPGCRRPAARCDLDHTVPWDQGGMTCECGLAPRCKR